MKNKVTLLLSLFIIMAISLGCGLGGFFGGSESESSEATESTETASGDAKKQKEKPPSGEVVKIGVKECDELATYINDNSEEIEGSIIARGIVYVYKNMILGKIKEGIEKMNDEEKQKLGDACAKSLEQLKKSMKK